MQNLAEKAGLPADFSGVHQGVTYSNGSPTSNDQSGWAGENNMPPAPTAAADYTATATGDSIAAVRPGMTIPAAASEYDPNNPDHILLSDGRLAIVGTGRGKLVLEARKIMSEDGENFSDCIAALVTTIDGRRIVLEDLYELRLPDFMKIVNRNGVKNVQ